MSRRLDSVVSAGYVEPIDIADSDLEAVVALLDLDEASDGSPRGSGAREERLHILADDAMEERLLGLVAFVANRDSFAGTGLEWTPLRNRYAGCGIEGRGGSPSTLNARFEPARHGFETDRPQADREP